MVVIFVIWPIVGMNYRTQEEYYIQMGQMERVWAVLFGSVFAAIVGFLALRGILTASIRSLVLRLTFVESLMLWLFLANLGWGVVGLLTGAPFSFVAGDTFRGSLIPVAFWIVRKSCLTTGDAVFLTKMILIGETVILIAITPLGHIPFSFAGRTFLSTVFFTLLFEERSSPKRIVYALLLIVGVYFILTTAAVRGILIIFVFIMLMNYVYRIREMKFSVMVFAFVLPTLMILGANELFELNLEGYGESAEKRFAGSTVGGRKTYGLDESLAQRIGESIDVGRTFAASSPVFLLTGFGNGAMLKNTLITPSEFATYKTNLKHHIFITIVAILYRNGILGLILYSGIPVFVYRVLRQLREKRDLVRSKREFMYMKLLCLYQISVMLLSFVTYWYVGNIIIALTLPLIEVLRRGLPREALGGSRSPA